MQLFFEDTLSGYILNVEKIRLIQFWDTSSSQLVPTLIIHRWPNEHRNTVSAAVYHAGPIINQDICAQNIIVYSGFGPTRTQTEQATICAILSWKYFARLSVRRCVCQFARRKYCMYGSFFVVEYIQLFHVLIKRYLLYYYCYTLDKQHIFPKRWYV